VGLSRSFYRSAAIVDSSRLVLDVGKSQLQDGGLYEVRIVNQSGEESSNAQVRVIAEPPRFILPVEESVTGEVGGEVTLQCRAVGVPMPEVTWLALTDEDKKEEAEISTSSGRLTVDSQVDECDGVMVVTTTLTIAKIKVKDALLRWICRARNEVGEERCTAKIMPRCEYKPAINFQQNYFETD
jgi:hypothetical protein